MDTEQFKDTEQCYCHVQYYLKKCIPKLLIFLFEFGGSLASHFC